MYQRRVIKVDEKKKESKEGREIAEKKWEKKGIAIGGWKKYT